MIMIRSISQWQEKERAGDIKSDGHCASPSPIALARV